jgi:flagellar basal-body rod modification protein FlgD
MTTISPFAATQPQARTGAPAITSDFNTFLKMLTTQMQNQDPLNPIDSTDYAVQLATFSGVEQQVRTNDLIGGLQRQFGLIGMAELANWVGQEARVAAPVRMDGAPVPLVFSPQPAADRAVLVVKDGQGRTVARDPVPPAASAAVWQGTGMDGRALPSGDYTLTVEHWQGERMLSAAPVEHYAPITEARNTPAGVVVVLAGRNEVPATAITGLREKP